jgi:hypothetical protein
MARIFRKLTEKAESAEKPDFSLSMMMVAGNRWVG